MVKKKLNEGLRFKDLKGIVKPTLHIDDFASKMGNDDDVAVLSFYVRSNQAADDLVSWFEKGYEYILDADRSPGEVKPNRYLVYVEIERRSILPDQIEELLEDLTSLTEHEPSDWKVEFEGNSFQFDPEIIRETMPLSPTAYRTMREKELNEMRQSAGLKTKNVHTVDADIRAMLNRAGL